MLSELTVRNFKSLVEARLPLGRISVLIGENGSGKSSFIHALGLLKQSLGASSFLYSGSLLDLGTFVDVLHRGADTGEIELGVRGSTPLPDQLLTWGFKEARTEFTEDWTTGSGSLTRLVAYRMFDNHEVRGDWNSVTGGRPSPAQVQLADITFTLALNVSIGSELSVSGYSPPTGIDPNIIQRANYVLNLFLSAPSGVLGRIFLVTALRGIERQSYDLGDQTVLDLASPKGSLQVGQALVTNLVYERRLEPLISAWMNRITGRNIEGRALPGRRASVDSIANKNAINIVNEGFGSNQLSHVLTQLAILPDDSVLAIEEPEVHLHPAAQSKFVGVLVEAITSKASQLILTTHSEHILYTLMAMVAEGTLTPDQVAIHHVTNDKGVTSVRNLELDTTGRIAGGLPGFFDAQIQEFRRFLEAADK